MTRSGSPPRAWGRPRTLPRGDRHHRFTPTRVGTTSTPLWTGRSVYGSPPRAWGRPGDARRPVRGPRFTPTRVGTTIRPPPGRPRPSVHPHARGDDRRVSFGVYVVPGSPPRAWGRPHRQAWVADRGRFTPTRVGTTRNRTCTRPRSSVHPHARGDDYPTAAGPAATSGSPPRAWGRHKGGRDKWIAWRFTPTRVGRTRCASGSYPPLAVHPHARGDDGCATTGYGPVYGSPPRAWGRLHRVDHVRLSGRFTPTRVGTTLEGGVWKGVRAVHPHARGDDWQKRAEAAEFSRFTPTRVGTTRQSAPAIRRPAVHPHARGDDSRARGRLALRRGSPPRAWGRLPCARRAPLPPAVHPHARGDDDLPGAPRDHRIGSPPRAWGRRSLPPTNGGRRRFTPTRVGTTRAGEERSPDRTVHPHARGDDGRSTSAAPSS